MGQVSSKNGWKWNHFNVKLPKNREPLITWSDNCSCDKYHGNAKFVWFFKKCPLKTVK